MAVGTVLLTLFPEQVAANLLTAAFMAGLISLPSLYRMSVAGNLGAWQPGVGLLDADCELLGGGDGDGDLLAALLLRAVTAGVGRDLAVSGLGLASS